MQNDTAALAAPTVTVIIATYNRTHTLRHAVQSVCHSSSSDWELIVVGDGCTNDSAECVASFNDPRIRSVKLPDRTGNQSGPNNHGIALSRGKYVAFLNHDDLYLPNHLGASVAELERSGADLVWVPCAVARPQGRSGWRSSVLIRPYRRTAVRFQLFALCYLSRLVMGISAGPRRWRWAVAIA